MVNHAAIAPLVTSVVFQCVLGHLSSVTVISGDETELVKQHRQLKLDNAKLSAVDDFVVISRNERRMGSINKQLGIIRGMRKTMDVSSRVPGMVAKFVVPIFYMLCYLAFGGTPVARLPTYWLFPLTYLISVGEARHGDVSMIVWVVLCHFAGKAIYTSCRTLVNSRPWQKAKTA